MTGRVLTATDRWHIREKWKAGEDIPSLAFVYNVPVSEVDAEIDSLRRQIESRSASPPKVVALPTSGLECLRCGAHRYGGGVPSLLSGVVIAYCAAERIKTGHRIVTSNLSQQPVTVAHARSTDPDTSHEAARSVGKIRESQQAIFAFLREYGAHTDEEIWETFEHSGISPSGARTRRSELVTMGLVRDSGQRKRLQTGRRAIVWEVT